MSPLLLAAGWSWVFDGLPILLIIAGIVLILKRRSQYKQREKELTLAIAQFREAIERESKVSGKGGTS